MTSQNKRYRTILKAVFSGYYTDLGNVDIMEDSDLENIKITVTPFEGIHKDKEYIITLKFQKEENWPHVYIDSELYDKIKTTQYLQGRGRVGYHKGICIKNLGYGYIFSKNFKELCDNKWENYIYYLISVFNNLQDFEKGNGIKSNYKTILSI